MKTLFTKIQAGFLERRKYWGTQGLVRVEAQGWRDKGWKRCYESPEGARGAKGHSCCQNLVLKQKKEEEIPHPLFSSYPLILADASHWPNPTGSKRAMEPSLTGLNAGTRRIGGCHGLPSAPQSNISTCYCLGPEKIMHMQKMWLSSGSWVEERILVYVGGP